MSCCAFPLLILMTPVVYSGTDTTRGQVGSKISTLKLQKPFATRTADIECFKTEDKNHKCVFTMHSGKIRQHLISDEYKGRVHINTSEKQVDVELLNFTSDDLGRYVCNFNDHDGNFGSETYEARGVETSDGNSHATTPAPELAEGPEKTNRRRGFIPFVLLLVLLLVFLRLKFREKLKEVCCRENQQVRVTQLEAGEV